MRGGFVRGGHSRSHPPESSLRRKQDQTLRLGKKGRMDEEGQAFVGDMNPSLTPREENWMQDNEIPREDIPVQKRSFSDTVNFFSHEDLDFALTEGPWKILDHYLSIRFWTPNFNPEKDVIDRIAAWVRLPGLAIEYYEETMLSKIGNVIGRTLKVDTNTADKRRGKFARLCVELNLAEPLVGQYSINGVKYKVEYEGLHLICFDCGKVGHDKTSCPRNKTQAAREEVTRRVETHVAGDGVQHADDEEGQRRSDKQDNPAEDNFVNTKIDKSARGKNSATGNGEGTRFAILQNQDDELAIENQNSLQNIPAAEHVEYIPETPVFPKSPKRSTQPKMPFNQQLINHTSPTNPETNMKTNNIAQKSQTNKETSNSQKDPQPKQLDHTSPNLIYQASQRTNQILHNHENWISSTTTPDSPMVDTFIENTTPVDAEMKEAPDPKSPDHNLHSIESDVMLEAAQIYEKELAEQRIEENIDKDANMMLDDGSFDNGDIKTQEGADSEEYQ
ncbi:uncharacterized protein DS421_2g55700 [Arachis hypogaea]|nr:uncharacterized protein DS421_2g55700 [Arachis hypogaea]